MKVDGGLVKDVVSFPGPGKRIAARGVWSGGKWSPEKTFQIYQYRNQTRIGTWQVTGVDHLSRTAEVALILSPTQVEENLAPNDILIFGEGFYSTIQISETSIPTKRDCSIELGPARYHGVALLNNPNNLQVIVFHENVATLPNSTNQQIWWRDKEFYVRIFAINERSKQDEYQVEFYLESKSVSLSRFLKTLEPVGSFILSAAQEMLFLQPYQGGRRYNVIHELFEPELSLAPGSVRVFVRPADPEQIPLLVQLDDPIRLLVQVLNVACGNDISKIFEIPAIHQVQSVDLLLGYLENIVKSASKKGDFVLRAPGLRPLPLGRKAFNNLREMRTLNFGHQIKIPRGTITLKSDHIESTSGLSQKSYEANREAEDKEDVPRIEQRRGFLFAINLLLGWCEVRTNDEQEQYWQLSFSGELEGQVIDLVGRNVIVEFDTVSPLKGRRGDGILTSIQSARLS